MSLGLAQFYHFRECLAYLSPTLDGKSWEREVIVFLSGQDDFVFFQQDHGHWSGWRESIKLWLFWKARWLPDWNCLKVGKPSHPHRLYKFYPWTKPDPQLHVCSRMAWDTVFVSSGCRNKLPQSGWLKAAEMYFLPVLDMRCWIEVSAGPRPSFCWLWHSWWPLSCSCTILAPASHVLSLCLSMCPFSSSEHTSHTGLMTHPIPACLHLNYVCQDAVSK